MNALFDTHCHLQDPRYEGQFDLVVARARDAGVSWMLNCAYDAASIEDALGTAGSDEAVLTALGYHPHEADEVSETMLADLESSAVSHHIVAIGEIGLDYYRNHSDHANQLRILERQLEIALALRKPVSVHSRAAEDAILAPLSDYAVQARTTNMAPGVMHCFGGTVEQARPFVELGFLISIPCTVTYPNAHETRRLARELPLESLVVETDSPYLPPQNLRGKRNEPAHVGAAVQAMARERGTHPTAVARATTDSATSVFRVPAEARR